MKKITYESYIKKHELDTSFLPSDIQDKIGVFKKMLELENSVEEHDKQELENRLSSLDKEIVADLKELKPLYKQYSLQHDKTKKNTTHIKKTSINADEAILAELMASKKNKRVMLSSLRALGLKTKLEKVTTLGKYRITRVSFCFYCYTITEIGN